MIISASRRTDIPAYFSEWFYNRIRAGCVLVRNPMNFHQIGKISLSPDVVDGIVFWSKNPAPMIDRLDELREYPYYFQFTLTAYGKDVEPNVPPKDDAMIPSFRRLSEKIGKEKVVWRYDPILFNEKYTFAYHLRSFGLLASKLAGCTEKCTVSFLDFYRKTEKNTRPLNLLKPTFPQKEELTRRLSAIARDYGIEVDVCAEDLDLGTFGIRPASCIDKGRLERLGGYKLKLGKDKNQRPECGCAASVDIGAYNTCKNGCLYCYANDNPGLVNRNCLEHDPSSPLLFGKIGENDVIKVREARSCKDRQLNFWDFQP